MTKYVVTGACVTHVPAAGPNGPLLVTLYQGAPLPEGVPADRVKHLLDNNLIAKASNADEAMAEQQDNSGQGDSEAADPKPLNGRSSKADLVAHAVANGMNQEDAEAMSRDDLLDTYVRKPGPVSLEVNHGRRAVGADPRRGRRPHPHPHT